MKFSTATSILSLSIFATSSINGIDISRPRIALRGRNQHQLQRKLGGDPDCNSDNAPSSATDLSNHLNDAINGNVGYGVIFRNRFDTETLCSWTNDGDCIDKTNRWNCNSDQSECGVATTYLHNDIITPNTGYALSDGFDKPIVGYVMVEGWTMNGGGYQGYAYYPVDSNSVDGRDWTVNGTPGRGCHTNKSGDDVQNYLCGAINGDSNQCVTYDSYGNSPSGDTYYCKCDYANFDPSQYGQFIANSLGNSNPAYEGQDFSACWFEENDFQTAGGLQLLTEMQNSIYLSKDDWWNGAVGGDNNPTDNPGFDGNYMGWNEVTFDANIDDPNNIGDLSALAVFLPTNYNNLCDFDKDTVQWADTYLSKYWADNYGNLPIVMMKNTNVNGDGYTYQKEFFVQTYVFESGNCIKIDDSTGIAYFFGDGCCGC